MELFYTVTIHPLITYFGDQTVARNLEGEGLRKPMESFETALLTVM